MMVDLAGVHTVRAKGRVYVYAWRGGPRLKAAPGTDAFLEELLEARQGARSGERGKISGLCAEYRARDWWKRAGEPGCIARSTKKNWSPWLDKIQDHFGKLSVRAFDRPKIVKAIRKWRDQFRSTPRAADMAKQVLSHLLAFAGAQGELATNPCAKIENLYSGDRSEIIWDDADFARLEATASPAIWRAARLAALTGLRQGDLLRLNWSQIGKLAITVRTSKSRGKREALIPLYAELAAFVATIPKVGPKVLTNGDGLPWRSGFSSSWNKAVGRAKVEKHFHDLRGNAATTFYIALRQGEKTHKEALREVAETMAWSEDDVERLVDRYVNRQAVLEDRIRRLDANASRT